MKKILTLIIAVLLVFTLTGCEKNYSDINNEELKTMLANPDDYQFIDVRTSTEFYDYRIAGFSNLDVYILDDDHSLLDKYDKTKPVVLMCNSGNRSVDAANIFYEEGFTEIYNLREGIQGWNGETE